MISLQTFGGVLVASGSAVLVDAKGPIGTGVSAAIAHSGFRPPSADPSTG